MKGFIETPASTPIVFNLAIAVQFGAFDSASLGLCRWMADINSDSILLMHALTVRSARITSCRSKFHVRIGSFVHVRVTTPHPRQRIRAGFARCASRTAAAISS